MSARTFLVDDARVLLTMYKTVPAY